jgi:hypothetical protein
MWYHVRTCTHAAMSNAIKVSYHYQLVMQTLQQHPTANPDLFPVWMTGQIHAGATLQEA